MTTLHQKAQNGLLAGEVLTTTKLNEQTGNGTAVWHYAAEFNGFKDIPQRLFTEKAMNIRDQRGNTVWHFAAWHNQLKYIPRKLFTEEALNQTNLKKESVWHLINKMGTIKSVPKFLITEELYDSVFSKENRDYIEKVISDRKAILSDFIEKNPKMANDKRSRRR